MKKIIILATALLFCFRAAAQHYSIGTNIADAANMGTFNLDGSVSLERHWSLFAGARYNPFTYGEGADAVTARQQAYYLGSRYWPWHVYSGWWLSGKAQYQEYNRGGFSSPATTEGDRVGLGLGAGFTYMLHPHLNLEFGLGFWAGYDAYVRYACPICGVTEESGAKAFILPNDLMLAVAYVF